MWSSVCFYLHKVRIGAYTELYARLKLLSDINMEGKGTSMVLWVPIRHDEGFPEEGYH